MWLIHQMTTEHHAPKYVMNLDTYGSSETNISLLKRGCVVHYPVTEENE